MSNIPNLSFFIYRQVKEKGIIIVGLNVLIKLEAFIKANPFS